MIINIITSIAIALIVLEIVIINVKQKADSEAVERIEDMIIKKPSSVEVKELSSKLEAIDGRVNLNEIAIKLLNDKAAQDHRDLVDIRERYILWRKPINWAGDYTETESEERS